MDTSDAIRRIRRWGLAAAGAGAAIDVLYLRAIADQGGGPGSRVGFVSGFIAGMAVLSLIGAIAAARDERLAGAALLAAALGDLSLGILAAFSIGFGLVAAGVLALWGALVATPPRSVALAAILSPIIVLAAGFALTG